MSESRRLSSEVTVEDEEGVVDRKTKEQIMDLRGQVDNDERTLYVERMSDPEFNFSVMQANQYWGISVRQYLRGIKRLWSDDDEMAVKNVDQYWEELVLGREQLVPPDKGDYQFSITRFEDKYSDRELRQLLDLPRGVDVPKPEEKVFRGLGSILKTNRISHTWFVKTSTRGPPPEHETMRLEVTAPVPKHILENAIEAADNFLQQAGVGFEVGVPAYMGGEEPGL